MNLRAQTSVQISNSKINGEITAPPSKSVSQRVAAAALIKGGKTIIQNYGKGNDELVALNVLKQCGCLVEQVGTELIVDVPIKIMNEGTFFLGESGLSCRLFSVLLPLLLDEVTIQVAESLQNRPMQDLKLILNQLSAQITHLNEGFFPMKIENASLRNQLEIDGSISSQFLTGLLFAIASQDITQPISIRVNDLVSKPYLDLTIQVLSAFQLNVPKNNNYQQFEFLPFENNRKMIQYTIEGDWSNGAFLLVAGAIAGKIKLYGLDVFSSQGDKAILNALMDTGAKMSITTERIIAASSSIHLNPFQFDASECPDLFPPLVALAACCNGTSVIKGVNRLIHKETNRAVTLVQAFDMLSIEILIQDDLMIIKGGIMKPKGIIEAPNDHRIVMAIAVAALRSTAPVIINNWQAVEKSYPHFFDDLSKIGVNVTFHGNIA